MREAKMSTWKRSELHGKRDGKRESVMEVKAQMLLVHEASLLTSLLGYMSNAVS